MPNISFVICSHRAPPSLFGTLGSILKQEDLDTVEVILVNNGFSEDRERCVRDFMNESLVVFRMVTEKTPGLGFARRRGFRETKGNFLVLLDDDNSLGEGFLPELLAIISRVSDLGGICPVVVPVWEERPADWLVEFGRECLSYNAIDSNSNPFEDRYWPATVVRQARRPPGGGMIICRSVAEYYLEKVTDPRRIALSRQPNSLVGCEDEDIYRGVAELGLGAYTSLGLRVYHHIPAARTGFYYLIRLNFQMIRSLATLDRMSHGNKGFVLKDEIRVTLRRLRQNLALARKRHKSIQLVLLECVRDVANVIGHST